MKTGKDTNMKKMTEEKYMEKLTEFEEHYSKMVSIVEEIRDTDFAEPIGVDLFPEPNVQLSPFGKLPQCATTRLLYGEDHFTFEINGTLYFSSQERKELV